MECLATGPSNASNESSPAEWEAGMVLRVIN
jgi:hypothetical protein